MTDNPPGYPVYLTTTKRLVGYLAVEPHRDMPYIQFHCWRRDIIRRDEDWKKPIDPVIHFCTLKIDRDQHRNVRCFWIEPGQQIHGVRGWTPA